jgi:ADP-ribose pyrophosphatase
VEIVATVGDKILIEQQDQPDRKNNITLISGRADQDEEPIKEAKRELLEETGYQSDDWSLFLKHGKDGKVLHEVYYFIARNCKKIKEPELDAGEKITTQLITFDKFIDLVDEPRFWVSQEFKNYLLRLQLDRKKKEDFKKILFP